MHKKGWLQKNMTKLYVRLEYIQYNGDNMT